MKTRIITLFAAVLFSTIVFADDLKKNMKEEVYINDIPFDTYTIKREVIQLNALNIQFEMVEESYINDIPFNTAVVADQTTLEQADSAIFMKDESYIDDIPFDTQAVVKALN